MSRIASFRRLWPYYKPQLPALVFASLLSIPMAALTFGPAPALKFLSDEVLVKRDPHALHLLVIALPAASLAAFLIRFLNLYFIRAAANRMIQNLRNDLYRHLLGLPLSYLNEAQGGVLLSRVINDVQVVARAVSCFVDAVREPLSLAALLGYAFYLNWRLTLATLVLVPACAAVLANAGKHSKRYSNQMLDKLGEMSALLSQSIAGMRVVQAFSLERHLRGQFMRLNRAFLRVSRRAIRVEELSRPGMELVFGLVLAALMFYVGLENIKGRMSAGDVIAFFTCFGIMLQPLRKLSELNVTFAQSAAAVENIFQVLAHEPEIRNLPDAVALPAFSREIEFRGITLQYPGSSTPVLSDFSLTLKKGEVVALVGPSGAGKSTVLALLPRFFDPQKGSIAIDGHELCALTLDSLRAQVAFVTQEIFLFHDTVRANIRGGDHSVPEEKIVAAAQAAQAWSFIEKLPQGLDTVIGDRGQKLSGGERQRLSIARAILKDAPILLLDEATSALDSENEKLVQAALDKLMQGRTALVVAHRLSTVRQASRILVMEKGKIVEEGSHEKLLALGGAYSRALSLQEPFAP
jgi:ATP-binding cassette, subfamily B, bacterial MsbA